MYSNPPMYSHGLYPQDMIPYSDMHLLTRHCTATIRLSPDQFEREAKKFSPDERRLCARLYQKMRDHGFFLMGINAAGEIKWGLMLKSRVQEEMESGLEKYEKMSIPQLKAMCGTGEWCR